MDDMDDSDEHAFDRPVLVIDLPPALSGEAALLLVEVMQCLAAELGRMYKKQIRRAQIEQRRAVEEFSRKQEVLRRERQFRAAQLNLPFYDDDVPF